jgi:hypothetical protein
MSTVSTRSASSSRSDVKKILQYVTRLRKKKFKADLFYSNLFKISEKYLLHLIVEVCLQFCPGINIYYNEVFITHIPCLHLIALSCKLYCDM